MGIKKVKLNYQEVAKRRSNEIAYVVSRKHIDAVNNSIKQKHNRNILEQQSTETDAKDYIVKQKGK